MDEWKDSSIQENSSTHDTIQHYRQVLRYITDIGASLRLQMDVDILLKRVAVASCEALQFRYSALCLDDEAGSFRMRATSGVPLEQEEYLRQHPIPKAVMNLLMSEEYRISRSYFCPAEASIWHDKTIKSYFVVVNDPGYQIPILAQGQLDQQWQDNDLLFVPLMSADNTLLGFLSPDAPLNGLRPTVETLELLELFANQAAVVIEGARLYAEARRSNEERGALIEIGRALSDTHALRDLQTVYQTIYAQVRQMMPVDAFFVARYEPVDDRLFIDFLIDEAVVYPADEYESIPPWMRKLLTKKNVGYFFNTAHEYEAFLRQDSSNPERSQILIGSMRLSESLLFVPIHYSHEAIGIVSVQYYQPYAYTQRHMNILREIAVQAGLAITNARLYEELREAVELAQESEKLKNHFLMTASHELRTPLTAVQGYLELLGIYDETLDVQIRQRFITNARRAAEELVLLLGNVMDTSRVDQDRVSLNLSRVPLNKTVQAILEILEPTTAREQRPIEVAIDDELLIWADDLRVRQILLNIVSNALKYTPPAMRIALSATVLDWELLRLRLPNDLSLPDRPESGQFCMIAIRDWGSGINPEDQQRLFMKFMRLPNALNSTQRGAGLGLYLCRQLTDAMGGRIWVESRGIASEGTTFYIALPCSLEKQAETQAGSWTV